MKNPARHLLVLCLFCAALVPARAAAAPSSPDSSFDQMRARWVALLVGDERLLPSSDPALRARAEETARELVSNGRTRDPRGTGHWDKLITTPDRNALWFDIGRLARGAQLWVDSLKRVERLAVAAKTPGSPLYNNPALLADIVSALDWITRDYYHEKIVRKGLDDWWQLEIGVPLFLGPVCMLLHEDLPPPLLERCIRAMDAMNPDPATIASGTPAARPATGSAIINKNRGALAVAILLRDPARLDRVRANLARVFVNVESGDGFYADGSFVMHRVYPYNAGYGLALFAGLADYGAITAGTPWALDAAQSARLADWAARAYAPFLWRGDMMSLVRGREIARWDAGEPRAGGQTLVALLRAAAAAHPDQRPALQSLAARLLAEAPDALGAYDRTSPYDLALARRVAAAPSADAAAPRLGFFAYPAMDRAVQRSAAWAAGLALHSTRIASHEALNGENRRGWHTGSGMVYLYNADPAPFAENYWATVDPFRLPGTTVVAGASTGGERSGDRGGSPLVGSLAAPPARDGASAGLATFTLPAAKSTLQGRKTWFFLPDAVVHLVAGLTGEAPSSVETIVENRKLRREGPQTFLVDGQDAAARSEAAEPLRLPAVRWAWLASASPEKDAPGLGLVFPEPTPLLTRRETRTDTWRAINTGSTYRTPDTRVTERYQTLWLDHGPRPAEASAAFALLPAASAAQTAAFAEKPPFAILANTAAVQALRAGPLTLAAFGPAGGALGEARERLSASGPALVALRAEADGLALTVCDPTQPKTGTLTVELGRPAGRLLASDPAVKVLQTTPTLRLAVKLDGLAGLAAAARFAP